MERFLTTPKKTQQSILTFAVKNATFYICASSFASKMEKCGPGRPKKNWYDAAKSESYSSIGVLES